jgi:hypothetical protein
MKSLSKWLTSAQMRRLAVAASLAAAVAASVLWAESARSDRVESASVNSGEHVAATPAHQHVPIARPAVVGARPAVRGDPSLPDAKEALQGGQTDAAEPPPAF